MLSWIKLAPFADDVRLILILWWSLDPFSKVFPLLIAFREIHTIKRYPSVQLIKLYNWNLINTPTAMYEMYFSIHRQHIVYIYVHPCGVTDWWFEKSTCVWKIQNKVTIYGYIVPCYFTTSLSSLMLIMSMLNKEQIFPLRNSIIVHE